ncbi:MAG: hypothetical protein RLZZ245_199 [Verrucomicrobiota bacterium]
MMKLEVRVMNCVKDKRVRVWCEAPGLQGADLWVWDQPRRCGVAALVMGFIIFLCLGVLQAEVLSSKIAGTTYEERTAAFVRYLASATPRNANFPKEAMPYYAARLQLGVDVEKTRQQIDTMLDATVRARPDPFNMHAVMHAYFLNRDAFTVEMREKIKRIVSTSNFSRPAGVSLNYELMRGGAGYLAAQEWPDLVDSVGNGAAKIQERCRYYLMRQFEGTCSRNASEYDAPVYYGTDFAPARMVAEFSKDVQLARAAKMTLDFMLIQTGAHWQGGYHVSTAGRGKYWGSLNLSPHSASPTNGMAFLLFGARQLFNLASAPQAYWLAHPGKALDTGFLGRWQASLPKERTVLANQIWPSHRQIVQKMAWFSGGYALASQREDGSPFESFLFKECRRTMLKWESSKPASTFTVIQENRRRPNEKRGNAFAYGENPYCQTFQYQGTLLGVYDVPDDYGYWVTRAPFTTAGSIIKRLEKDAWVFCHGGSLLFAFRFLEPSRWDAPNRRENLELLRCDVQRCGWILETSALGPFAGGGVDAELERFSEAVLARTEVAGDVRASPPRLVFKNLKGHTLDLTWKPLASALKDECKLNGKPVDYSKFPLLRAPGVLQESGGPLKIQAGARSRVWDFKKWEIRDE